jgi:hypothetical protein
MVSLGRRFLFVHVPKTAGNSLQNLLREYSEDRIVTVSAHQDGVERFEVRNDRYSITKHATLRRYRNVLDPEVFAGLYKFATIRNPWDRAISAFFSPHRGKTGWDRASFVRLLSRLQPLRHFVCLETGAPLAGAVDFLMRFEHLDEDFSEVCARLDLASVALPRRNRSQHDHYSRYYDDELEEMVRLRFGDEIEHGGYSFVRA